MSSLNKVMLIARLGKDPEVRYTQGGTAVASFSAATSEKFKNKNGEWEERTEWHNLVLWGRLAEICGEYLSKGSMAYFEGRLQTRKWQDKDGNDRYSTEVVAERMQMLDGKKSSGSSPSQGGGGNGGYSEPGGFNPDDDIPFHRGPSIWDAKV